MKWKRKLLPKTNNAESSENPISIPSHLCDRDESLHTSIPNDSSYIRPTIELCVVTPQVVLLDIGRRFQLLNSSFDSPVEGIHDSASGCLKHKSSASSSCDTFSRYSKLCGRNVLAKYSLDVTLAVKHPDLKVFEKYSDLCRKNVVTEIFLLRLNVTKGYALLDVRTHLNAPVGGVFRLNERAFSYGQSQDSDHVGGIIENVSKKRQWKTPVVESSSKKARHTTPRATHRLIADVTRRLYVYDDLGDLGDYNQQGQHYYEVENIMRHFGGIDDIDLDPEIVEGLIHFLDAHNQLLQLFRIARDKCREIHIPEFIVRLYNAEGARGYELPTSNALGEVVFDSGVSGSIDFDVIIQEKAVGFYPELKLKAANGSRHEWKVTMLEYYRRFGYLSEVRKPLVFHHIHAMYTGQKSKVLYTIEFQKRGLRHCHTLLWVNSKSKIKEAQDVDRFISAELPDPEVDPEGYKVVSELMTHGPCGAANTSAPCIKGLPEFVDDTVTDYSRPTPSIDTSKCNKSELQSSNFSVFKHERSIGSIMSKPMIKFVKEADCPRVIKINNTENARKSTVKYAEMYRNISKGPKVRGNKRNWNNQKSQQLGKDFMMHNKACYICGSFDHLQYTCKQKRQLNGKKEDYLPRRCNSKSLIGRLTYVHPTTGEIFYFRMLLCHRKGSTEFVDVQTLNDVFYPTYQTACEALGLLGDDKERDTTMQEARRTAHLRFKLPLELKEESICRITKNSHLGKLLANTDLIIWDEAPMDERRCFEALGRSLRDILKEPHFLFGGKDERSLINSFASWLLDIGDGKTCEPDPQDPDNTSWDNIYINYCIPEDENGLQNLINFIYDQSTLQTPSVVTMQQKLLFFPKNETADMINSKVLEMVQGEKTYLSHDKATPTDNDGAET
nr:DNA helicase [Tanacetum cinerariifolium]